MVGDQHFKKNVAHSGTVHRRIERNYSEVFSLLKCNPSIKYYIEFFPLRFVVYTPAVTAPPIVFHTSHPPPSKLWDNQKRGYVMKSSLSPLTSILHPIQSAMMTQFPDPRLIQYDCGKKPDGFSVFIGGN